MYKHYGGHPIGYKNLDKFYESNIFYIDIWCI